MSELICAGVTHRETEFAEVLPGVRVFGACGPCALASVASNALAKVVTTDAVYHLMQSAGLCDSEGVTTLANLQIGRLKLGLRQLGYHSYTDAPWPGWAEFFTTYAGVAPFVAQVVNGRALVDAISGDGENANNLQSHFVCVLGRNTGGWSPRANRNLPAGFWVADGCNFAGGNDRANGFNAANVLQFYPDSVMGAADPRGALVMQGAVQMAWVKQSDGTGKDDAGHACGVGVMNAIEAAGYAGADGLLGETYYSADDSFTPLNNGAVFHYNKASNAVRLDGAGVAVALWEALQASEAALQAEKAKPAPEPPAPPAPEPPAPVVPTLVLTVNGQAISLSGDTATLVLTAKA